MKKLISILVALAMMAMLSITAFAAEQWETDVENYSDSLAESVLTKVFDVPDGVAAPQATFTFNFAPDSANPTGPSATVTEDIQMAAGTGTQTKNLYFNSFIGLNDSTKDINLTQPGEYVFTVSEQQNTYNAQTGEKVTYDTGSYKLRIYVINKEVPAAEEGGTPTTELAIKAITVAPLTTTTTPAAEEGGTPTTSTTEGDKIDPEDKTPEGKDPTNQKECVGSAFKFTNYYTKKVTDNTNDGAFNVGKKVTGQGDTSKPFDFTVSVLVDEQTLVDEASPLVLSAKINNAGDPITATVDPTTKTATFQNVKLKDGDKLVFATFYAGSKVTITENLLGDTTIQNNDKYTKTAAGTDINLVDYADVGKTADITVNTAAYNVKSSVKVTNDLDASEITPTGILISNLPYIALALVAIGGLVAYVVVRRRQDDEA